MYIKTILFWYSGTGNSLAIARDLAAKLGDTELVPMTRAMSGIMPQVGKAGFVFPVYAFGLPGIVARFLKNMPVSPGAYYFSVADCAGTPGAPHRQARSIMQARGGRLAAGWTLFMPSNYPVMRDRSPAEVEQRCFERMQARLPEIAESIGQNRQGPFEDSSIPFRWIGQLVNPWIIRQFLGADKHFWVESTCRQCGLCAKVCPVGNIVLVDKKPTWRHRCEQCMACLQWCPAEAIQYGKATKARKRYHHPQAKAKDFMLREESPA